MTAIEFEHVSKQYRLGLVSTKTLSHDIRRFWIIERQDGTISESGMKSGMSSESGMPNDKWPKSWPKKWPNHAEMILEAIAHDTTITVLELENQLPIGHSTIAKLLVALQTEGYLDRVKDNTGTHWQILENK